MLSLKVTADKEGAGPPVPNILVERIPEAEPRRFYVLSADMEARGHNRGLSKLCSAVITWKSDKTTQRRELGTNQSDYCEKLHGKGKHE